MVVPVLTVVLSGIGDSFVQHCSGGLAPPCEFLYEILRRVLVQPALVVLEQDRRRSATFVARFIAMRVDTLIVALNKLRAETGQLSLRGVLAWLEVTDVLRPDVHESGPEPDEGGNARQRVNHVSDLIT